MTQGEIWATYKQCWKFKSSGILREVFEQALPCPLKDTMNFRKKGMFKTPGAV
jgi:hypothetical protein